jgi:hypothetical protein
MEDIFHGKDWRFGVVHSILGPGEPELSEDVEHSEKRSHLQDNSGGKPWVIPTMKYV